MIHAQLSVHGESTSVKAMRKSLLIQRLLRLTKNAVQTLANALRTTRSTFIVSAIL